MQKALANRENARKRGVAGATARWSKHASSMTQALDGDMLGHTTSAPTSPTQPKDIEPNFTTGFLKFWDAWGENERRSQKRECFEFWISESLESSTELICAHVKAYQSTHEWKNGYITKTYNYLSQGRWQDDFTAPNLGFTDRRVI